MWRVGKRQNVKDRTELSKSRLVVCEPGFNVRYLRTTGTWSYSSFTIWVANV
jgi:hypothetical protein